jgi:biotin synthase-related radical SAM superfamily protein
MFYMNYEKHQILMIDQEKLAVTLFKFNNKLELIDEIPINELMKETLELLRKSETGWYEI